jgi:hypothetical protein
LPTSTNVSHCPRPKADAELAWFFPMAAQVGKTTRLFEVLAPGGTALGRLDFQVRSIRAYNTILERLRVMGDPDAGILACAYADRAWPSMLAERFGLLTGIMVRLAVAEAVSLPDDDDALSVLEMHWAERMAHALVLFDGINVQLFERKARVLFDRASRAYQRQRGGMSSVLVMLQ